MRLEEIRQLNKNMIIKDVEDITFKEYGKLLKEFDFNELIEYTEKNVVIPKEGNGYVASVAEIEKFKVINSIKNKIYGGLEIEAGSCTGQNSALTGVEYHQGSEVTIAVTDCVLIIGKLQDMEDDTYDSSKAEAFYLKRGQAIELYGTTLHYTPCKVKEDGFITVVVLLRGTNMSIENSEGKILTKKNKYFITHESQKEKIRNGAYPGLKGNLIDIKYK